MAARQLHLVAMASDTVNIGLRLPTWLRDRLAAVAAALPGRSMNSEITDRLAASLQPNRGLLRLLEAIDLPKTVRIATPTTSAAVDRILTACRELGADRVTVAARADDLNYAQLVVLVESSSLLAIADDTCLSMARGSRILDVEDLFRNLDGLGLLASARMFTEPVPHTHDMAPAAAIDAMVKTSRPVPLDLGKFLDVLSGHGLFDESRFRVGSATAPA
jgi:hypothetical protein